MDIQHLFYKDSHVKERRAIACICTHTHTHARIRTHTNTSTRACKVCSSSHSSIFRLSSEHHSSSNNNNDKCNCHIQHKILFYTNYCQQKGYSKPTKEICKTVQPTNKTTANEIKQPMKKLWVLFMAF